MVSALAVLAAVSLAPTPPAPTRWAEDHAALLTPATRAALEAKLEAYERATHHQVIVWIGQTLGGAPLDDWAVRTFAAWKIGRKGIDDGLVVFVIADDHAIDIEVGYGLEDKVPDAVASRIIRDVMAPRLRAGDHDGAVMAGVDALLAEIEGHSWSATEPARDGTASPLEWALGAIGVIIALLLFIKYPRLGMLLLWSTIGRAGSGGGGGGDGGFGGGGGRSGGGGARGKW